MFGDAFWKPQRVLDVEQDRLAEMGLGALYVALLQDRGGVKEGIKPGFVAGYETQG